GSDRIRTEALDSCFDAFSSREPVSTSLENALIKPPGARLEQVAIGFRSDGAAVRVGDADGGIIVRRRRPGLEGLQDGLARIAWARPQAGLGIDPNQLDAGRNLERDRRLVGERELQEIPRD